MKDLYRTTIIPGDFMWLDCIQGYLEMAQAYNDSRMKFVCDKSDETRHGSMLFVLRQLEAEGNIVVEFVDYDNDDVRDCFELKQVSLTVAGHKLLDELKQKSKAGAIKKRAKDLVWIVVTTVLTTLVVLKLKGL